MDEWRKWNEDFGWTHTFDITNKRIKSVRLAIRAWDVDYPLELDAVVADNLLVGFLIGKGQQTTTTEFIILKYLLNDGKLNVDLDIDSTHICGPWVCIWPIPCWRICSHDWYTKVYWSELRVTWDWEPGYEPWRLPVANAGGPYVVDEGSPFILDASNSEKADKYRWDFTNDGVWDTGWSPWSMIMYGKCDDYQGTVAVQVYNIVDSVQHYDTDTTTITVNNVAPGVVAGADQAVILCNEALLVGQSTDPGMCDTHTVRWDFGDGTSEEYAVTRDPLNATAIVNTTHKYSAAGTYTVTLEVEDDDGGVGVDYLTVVVTTLGIPLFSDVLWIFPVVIIANVLMVHRRRRNKSPIAN